MPNGVWLPATIRDLNRVSVPTNSLRLVVRGGEGEVQRVRTVHSAERRWTVELYVWNPSPAMSD